MLTRIKRAIKRTSVYQCYRDGRLKRSLRNWTDQDTRMSELYSQFLMPGDVCFDVGANIGNRTKIFLKCGANVVAVEPQDQCMHVLTKHFGKNPKVHLIQTALGEKEDTAQMRISNSSTLSSLSHDWIDAVEKSGRFAESNWNQTQEVRITTLDNLIREQGMPAFIKIDVEGYEYEVLKGLTQPVPALSLEFTPEYLLSTFRCVEHLAALGTTEWNYSLGESMTLSLADWVPDDEIIWILSQYQDNSVLGDVYVRFVGEFDDALPRDTPAGRHAIAAKVLSADAATG